MENDDHQELRDRINKLESTLRYVADRSNCYADDFGGGHGTCDSCTYCEAVKVLAEKTPSFPWQYRGNRHRRVQYNLSERRLIAAMAEQVDNVRMSQIIGENNVVTARDWYVAATFLQWLGTNVGMSLLQQAGWKYTRYDDDRKGRM